MKTYVLILSERFPGTHPKAGEETNFFINFRKTKIHTIRKNYDFWKKRFDQINSGKAFLSVRYWIGKPYKDPQTEFISLNNEDFIGIQKLTKTELGFEVDGIPVSILDLCRNDGLSLDDFNNWFKEFPKEPMAIIHFTHFRYE
jgi:hypothetical protein